MIVMNPMMNIVCMLSFTKVLMEVRMKPSMISFVQPKGFLIVKNMATPKE